MAVCPKTTNRRNAQDFQKFNSRYLKSVKSAFSKNEYHAKS